MIGEANLLISVEEGHQKVSDGNYFSQRGGGICQGRGEQDFRLESKFSSSGTNLESKRESEIANEGEQQ